MSNQPPKRPEQTPLQGQPAPTKPTQPQPGQPPNVQPGQPQYPPQPYQQPYPNQQQYPNQQPYQQPYPNQQPYQQPYDPQYQQPNQQIYDPQYQQPYPPNQTMYDPQQQQQYPPYQPPYEQPGQGFDPTSIAASLDPKLAAALSYILFIPSGICFMVLEKDNKFVRFHAMQSILFGAACLIAYFITMLAMSTLTMFLAMIGVPSLLSMVGLISNLFMLGVLVLWAILMLRAYRGDTWKLPIIGEIAEKQTNV